SPRQRTHPTIHFAIRCPSALHTEAERKACACASITELSTSRPSRTNTRFHESMTCLTSFNYRKACACASITGIFKTRHAVWILADKNGGPLHSQNCLLNSVQVVRVSGNAVRTNQHTSNIPTRNEPHSRPTWMNVWRCTWMTSSSTRAT
ncbi:hypothetical protein CLOM_g9592, partial [Closterium sp. NIES-68]